MAKNTCPVCGCVIASGGYETGGVVYCGEDCAKKNVSCGCGCGTKKTPAKPQKTGKK